MNLKPIFRFSSVLFGLLFVAVLSAAAASGSDNPTNIPSHMAAKRGNDGEIQLATPIDTPQQTQASNPTVDIWYGSSQDFGFLGDPQPMINILGNVSDADGIGSLEYRLNYGSWHNLSWKETASASDLKPTSPGGMTDGIQVENATNLDGPSAFESVNGASTNPRLASEGDFNIEIDVDDLNSGQNAVNVRAKDSTAEQNTTTKFITVNYTSGQTWPLPYTADWSDGLTDVAQVVDGDWDVVSGRLRPSITGYDRLVAIGELTAWDDYEVSVPATIHSFPLSDSGGVGIVARWQGHFVQGGEQPGTGWSRLGAYAYYRNRVAGPHFAFRTSNDSPLVEPGTLTLGTTYIFKLRVQTKNVPCSTGATTFFSFKVWEASKAEPSAWIFEECDDPSNTYPKGSALLVAHNADVSFGDATVLPVLEVNTATNGSGTVDISPALSGQSDAYLYGDQITLTATPSNDWLFSHWSGDLTSTDNPETITLTGDTSITANFIVDQFTITGNVNGNGTLSWEPVKQYYSSGDIVTFTADANSGWTFTGWSGGLSGSDSPESLTINGNTDVTANFAKLCSLEVPITGGGTVAKDPDQPSYTCGQEVELTATPNNGWTFTGWTGDINSTTNPETITLNTDKAVNANFAEGAYVLTTTHTGSGMVSLDPDQPTYAFGQIVTISAIPDSGWRFMNWGGDLSGTQNPLSLTVTDHMSIVSHFGDKNNDIFVPYIIASSD